MKILVGLNNCRIGLFLFAINFLLLLFLIHRNAQDIPQLIQIQLALLTQLWRLLKPEGMLLYATCSILSEENDAVIDTFIKNHNDATPMALPHPQALKTTHGYQTLPSHGLSDGFYTCGLLKS